MTTSPTLPSRVLGAVLGAAIGDAMGHPTEFMSLDAIRQKFGEDGVTGFVLFGEQNGKRFAPYTDDTQMAEVVLRSLLDGIDDADDPASPDLDGTMRRMADGFVDWAQNPLGGHRAPGNACLAGCAALANGTHWSEAGGAKAGGCGSVMRAYPFGLGLLDDVVMKTWAVSHSKLTHRDPIALAACAAMAVGMRHAMRGNDVDDMLSDMVGAARPHSAATADMMQRAWDEAGAGAEPDAIFDWLRAWAAHEAIAAAVYLVARHPDDFAAAVLEGANTEGDSDSIATLAGALVGARVGIEGIPKDWVNDVERSVQLQALARRAAATVEAVQRAL